jgi:hypothetical protein
MVVETRSIARKIVRTRAMLVLDSAAPMQARTVDINTAGVTVTVGNMVKVGQRGQLSFELLLDGKPQLISAKVSVTQCVFSGDGMKVGLHFVSPEQAVVAAVSTFMR